MEKRKQIAPGKTGFWKKAFGATEREDALLPSVDHKDPAVSVLDFEICAWRTNTCKSYLAPEEFIAFCRQVVAYCGSTGGNV